MARRLSASPASCSGKAIKDTMSSGRSAQQGFCRAIRRVPILHWSVVHGTARLGRYSRNSNLGSKGVSKAALLTHQPFCSTRSTQTSNCVSIADSYARHRRGGRDRQWRSSSSPTSGLAQVAGKRWRCCGADRPTHCKATIELII